MARKERIRVSNVLQFSTPKPEFTAQFQGVVNLNSGNAFFHFGIEEDSVTVVRVRVL
jgi:hypothetical protein